MSKKNRPLPPGTDDWFDRTEFAPEFPPYNDQSNSILSSGAASATDFTGLTVTEPLDDFQADALREVKDMRVSPRTKHTAEPKTKQRNENEDTSYGESMLRDEAAFDKSHNQK